MLHTRATTAATHFQWHCYCASALLLLLHSCDDTAAAYLRYYYCCTLASTLLLNTCATTAAHLRCNCCYTPALLLLHAFVAIAAAHLLYYYCTIALKLPRLCCCRTPALLFLLHSSATNTAAHLHCYTVLCICFTSLLQYYCRAISSGAAAILSLNVRLAAVVGLPSLVPVFCFLVASLLLVPLQASQLVSIF